MVCKLCLQENKAFKGSKWYCIECLILKHREWKRKYSKSIKGKLMRRKNEWRRKKSYEKYRSKKEYREYSNKRYHQMDENKKKARYYTRNAVRDGRLIRPKNCEKCGIKDWGKKRSMIEAHHYMGYEPPNWFKIQWLCTNCHKLSEGGGLTL